MKSQLFAALFLAVLTVAVSVPFLRAKNEQLQPYRLMPVFNRLRRDVKVLGEGGANRQSQGGHIGASNPSGSGGGIGYGHSSGYGHTVSADGRVPVWSSKNRFGESTLNVGGGATQHFGGPGGNRNLDKRVGADFSHRW